MTNKAKITAKYHKKSARFGFHEWNLSATDEFQKFIDKTIREAIELATKEYECRAWFPAEWAPRSDGVGGKPPADPMTVYVELPLGATEDDSPRWQFSLRDLVLSIIEVHQSHEIDKGGTGKIDDREGIAIATTLRDGLRELADMLDNALPHGVDANQQTV